MLPINEIYYADCIDIMSLLPDKSIDLVLTDPPYGLNIAKSGSLSIKGASNKKLEYKKEKWDILPSKKYFDEILRISKDQIIWGGNYFTDYLPPSQCWLVWFKKDGLPARTFADCELAWTSFKRPAQVFNCRWHGFIRDSKEKKYKHPTQKALELFKWCLKFVPEGSIIFDPFLGTGTTAIACLEMNYKYIGTEINEDYFNISLKRINQYK